MKKFCLIFTTFFCLIISNYLFAQVTGGPTVGSGSTASEFELKVDGDEFFPIGWYLTDKNDLQMAYDAGATVVLFYWNSIWNNYDYVGCKSSTDYDIDEYEVRLACFLNEVRSLNNTNNHDMRVLIDLDLKRAGRDKYTQSGDTDTDTLGFGKSSILGLVTNIESNYSDILFGWYVLDEPTQKTDLTPDSPTPHPREFYHDITKSIKSISTFPTIVVFTNPEAFSEYAATNDDSTVFEEVHYDILARDEYGYSHVKRSSLNNYSDENNVSRLAAVRSMSTLQSYESGLIKNMDGNVSKKMAFMTVAMIHDLFEDDTCNGDSGVSGDKDCFDQVDADFMIYQSLAPIIRGARSLMYYWYNPNNTLGGRQNTLDLSEDFISTFSSNSLGDIILKGDILDNNLVVSNFKANGNSISHNSYIWDNYNNGCAPTYTSCSPGPTNQADEPMFDWMARKYNGSYYVFAVNEYDPTVSVTFNLGNILSTDEMVYQVTELDMLDPTQNSQVNFNNDNKIKTSGSGSDISSFNMSFGSLQAKVFKIDVLEFSDTKTMPAIAWETLGGGITLTDIDNNGVIDLVVMGIENNAQADPFRYKIGWNIYPGSNFYFSDYSYSNFPGTGRGELSGISWTTKGGGISSYDIDSNGYPELFFLGIDNKSGYDDHRVKLNWNHYVSNNNANSQLFRTDYSYSNFPGDGRLDVASGNTLNTGGGLKVFDLEEDGTPELFLMSITNTNSSAINNFKYKIVNDFSMISAADSLIQNTGVSSTYSVSGVSSYTRGGDITVGNLDSDNDFEALFSAIDLGSEYLLFKIMNLNSNGSPESNTRPFSAINFNSSENILSAGIDMADIDGDGDQDLVFLGIEDHPQGNRFLIRFALNQINQSTSSSKLINQSNPKDEKNDEIPSAIKLGQNYPNPFNPTTQITYSISNEGQVELNVYDLQGRLVRALVNETKSPGNYSVSFNASELSSGIYFYTLTSSGEKITKKLTLIK